MPLNPANQFPNSIYEHSSLLHVSHLQQTSRQRTNQPTNQSTWQTLGIALSRKHVSLGNLNGRVGFCRLFIATFALWQCASRLHLSSGYLVLRFNNARHSYFGRGNGASVTSLNLRWRNFDGLTFKTRKKQLLVIKSLTWISDGKKRRHFVDCWLS